MKHLSNHRKQLHFWTRLPHESPTAKFFSHLHCAVSFLSPSVLTSVLEARKEKMARDCVKALLKSCTDV